MATSLINDNDDDTQDDDGDDEDEGNEDYNDDDDDVCKCQCHASKIKCKCVEHLHHVLVPARVSCASTCQDPPLEPHTCCKSRHPSSLPMYAMPDMRQHVPIARQTRPGLPAMSIKSTMKQQRAACVSECMAQNACAIASMAVGLQSHGLAHAVAHAYFGSGFVCEPVWGDSEDLEKGEHSTRQAMPATQEEHARGLAVASIYWRLESVT